jgi:hypothetical protein
MQFINNKYSVWYYNIINMAKIREINDYTYTEKHHIIPKSIGGNNTKENLVHLTAKEHFICHLLLIKMTSGESKKKMSYAVWLLCNMKNESQERYIPTSTQYNLIRTKFRKEISAQSLENAKNRNYFGENNPFHGRTHSIETKMSVTGDNHYTKRKDYDPSSHPSKQPGWAEANSKAQSGISKPTLICENCHQKVGGHGNYVRWHGANCKKVKVLKLS